MPETAAAGLDSPSPASRTVFYITEVLNSGAWWDHVIVRHLADTPRGCELGHARTYHKALIMVHLFAKDGDKCVVTPLTGPRREFDLAEEPKRAAEPELQQEPA